jgi:polysaccharide export outer membrane protein
MRYLPLLLVLAAAPALAQAPAPAPAPAQPALVTAAGPQRNADYILATGDSLKVTVFDEPDLTKSGLRIDADGTFTYPFLDRVQAAGRTTSAIRDAITTGLAKFVKSPNVSVEIDQFRPRKANVVGQVRAPGQVTLVGQVTLLEALAMVGYLTPDAGSEIQVTRGTDNAAVPGETLLILRADLQANKPEANIVLREGDLVFVSEKQKFTMTGFVRSPNQYTWERGMTVRIALALAGGITEKGSNRGIVVYRNVNGKQERKNIDQDDLVQPNDILEVRQRRL